MKVKTAIPLISVVDDDDSPRDAVDRVIRAEGYQSLTFASAAAFLESGRKYEMACVILDIDLIGMNGVQLQRRLANMNYSIPMIFVTAYEGALRETALAQGAHAILKKPCSREELLNAIQSALHSPDR